MIRALWRDLHAALAHDPAARSRLEVLLAYPGVHALFLHRIAHQLWNRDFKLAARLLSHVNRFGTGVEIHPGARIADGVFIDHGMGVVIGETAVVEEGCIIYKGVVLGGTTLEKRIRHPHLHRNVIVGSNACVLGAISVGEGARIGSASVVIKDVPAGATVVGVPGRIVTDRRPLTDELDHAALPDPVADVLRSLAAQQETLAERLAALEEQLRSRARSQPKGTARHAAKNAVAEGEDEPEEHDARKRAGRIF
ncbi:MAG: serine O-acetyltransferase [Myxococcaceae bacterium]|nr:serine O-acetyltransferase [Myxococcaceae bacterium]